MDVVILVLRIFISTHLDHKIVDKSLFYISEVLEQIVRILFVSFEQPSNLKAGFKVTYIFLSYQRFVCSISYSGRINFNFPNLKL